jgi:hypothetical protein
VPCRFDGIVEDSRLRGSLALACALLLVSCVSEDRTSTPLGGGWSSDRVRVSGWEATHISRQVSYQGNVVDSDVDQVHFFAPDCVIYSTNRTDGASYAVCGDRQPVALPFSIWKIDQRAVWGEYRINEVNQKAWQMLRVRDVLSVAAAQPPRTKKWRWTLDAAPLGIEPEWVRR